MIISIGQVFLRSTVSCLMPSPAFKVVRVNNYGESRDFLLICFPFGFSHFSFWQCASATAGCLGRNLSSFAFHVNFLWSLIAVLS